MPTESFKPILDRDTAIESAKPIIDMASPILKETVNYATNAFARFSSSKSGSKEETYPVLALYTHLVQMIDSIEVLISNCCGAPAELLLRIAFEAKLAIEYILELRSKRKKELMLGWSRILLMILNYTKRGRKLLIYLFDLLTDYHSNNGLLYWI